MSIAHGQMAAGELDERMNAFYDGKYDVLLATTHRGIRPGHSDRQHDDHPPRRHVRAGAAVPDPRPRRAGEDAGLCLSDDQAARAADAAAQKRLRLLGSLDSLGAGFTLASQDLDLRGAGNLLGEEQSGHIREVGYELYQADAGGDDRRRSGRASWQGLTARTTANGRRRSTSACRC